MDADEGDDEPPMLGQLELLPVAMTRAMCCVFAWCEVRCVAASAVPVPASETTSAAANETLRAITCDLLASLRLNPTTPTWDVAKKAV